MRIRYDYDAFNSLIIVNSKNDLESFLKLAGAQRGYAATFFTKVYNCIYKESEDLKYSYEKYYRCEFESFKEFIQKEFLLDDDAICEIFSILDSDDSLTLIKWDRYSYGESSLPDLIFDGNCISLFTKILTGHTYEN